MSVVELCSVRELVHELAAIVDATGARHKAIVEEPRRRHLEAQRTDTVS